MTISAACTAAKTVFSILLGLSPAQLLPHQLEVCAPQLCAEVQEEQNCS